MLRRVLLVLLVVVGTVAATRFLGSILAADGLSLAEAGILVLFALTFAWISIAFCTALAGLWRIVLGTRGSGDGLARLPPDMPLELRTALVMPVCHEEVAEVGARIASILRSVARTGALEHFDFFILSDSRRPEVARAEEALWARLCVELGAGGRLFYRRRTDNRGRKSGNVAEFCRRWGARYECFVVLDADSLMSGETLVELARLMQANPTAGLIQTVPQPVRSATLFTRIQQFASRLYGPLYAAGFAYWYPGKGNYWGHNAIIRTRAFMACCGLPALPGRPPLGGEILSHDFVEAALLQRAGWAVWVVPELEGSYEELPPTLDDYAKRDVRWCQGNLQHARLLALKGLGRVSRCHLGLGVAAYVAAPLWSLLLVLATFEAATTDLSDWVYFPDAGSLFPVWPVSRTVELIGLFSLTMGMLLAPKLLATALALARRERRRAYGGARALLRSVAAEILFAALLAPVLMVQQTCAVAATLLGYRVSWTAQRRGGVAQEWREVARRYLPFTLLGVAWGAIAWSVAPGLLVWLAPVLAGLVLSIPLAALSGRAELGWRAREAGWFLVPEEVAPPPLLAELPSPAPAYRDLPAPPVAPGALSALAPVPPGASFTRH